ncbi:hypothetical protein L4D08_15250 [Photobacterium chitinilyticum]|uniref:hypothetical protein n=1 Tax=Photobacterium chitinilyticum TaxID=2485123 RepID=UPI003D0A8584
MWLEAFNQQQKKRLQYFIWFCGVSFIVTSMLVQGIEIKEEAEHTRLNVLKQTFYKSASTLRQLWELQDKPAQLDIAGMNVEFTARGWPVVFNDKGTDCRKIWDLLASRSGAVSYLRFDSKKEMRSARYNSCYYQVSDGNWLELFYKNETIHINGFLTGQASFL